MKRFISVLLSLTLLISFAAITLVSCAQEKETTKKEEYEKKPVEVIEGDIFSERAAVDDELPDYDFGGQKFRVASYNSAEYYVKEEDRNQGNLLKDATFERNEAAEKRFNFEITTAYTGTYVEVNEWVSKSVLSGVDEFDLYCSMAADAGGAVLKNLFINWYDVPNVDFSKPWWSPSCANELTYDGKAILVVSEFNRSATSSIFCMIFNKNLANAYDMGNLYEVALNGDWTYEYFYDLIKDVYRDNDGDGFKSAGDFYGFEQNHFYGTPVNSWLYAFNNPTVAKDEDGIPQVAIKTDKINNIVNTLYELCHETNGVWYEGGSITNNEIFLAKRAIFAVAMIGTPAGEALRNFEDEYGLLPMPKWDETQTEYTSAALGSHTCLAIPKTAKDLEFVGTCIEALSAESYKKITPTFYEIALKTRYLRDNESKKVLDIIIDSAIYDFGVLYGNWKGFEFSMSSLMGSANNNFESYYQKRFPEAKLHYRAIRKVFDRLG